MCKAVSSPFPIGIFPHIQTWFELTYIEHKGIIIQFIFSNRISPIQVPLPANKLYMVTFVMVLSHYQPFLILVLLLWFARTAEYFNQEIQLQISLYSGVHTCAWIFFSLVQFVQFTSILLYFRCSKLYGLHCTKSWQMAGRGLSGTLAQPGYFQ